MRNTSWSVLRIETRWMYAIAAIRSGGGRPNIPVVRLRLEFALRWGQRGRGRVHPDRDKGLYGRRQSVQSGDAHRGGGHDCDVGEWGWLRTHGHERDRVGGQL